MEGPADVLSSGRQGPPPEPRERPWLTGARRLWRRRGARLGGGLLVAAVVLVLLQVTARPQQRVLERAAGPAPTVRAFPTPPFDRRPGRTPLPAPVVTGDQMSGLLPATGGPGPASATRAADLVLGRYCADPGRYSLTVEPYTEGRSVNFHRVVVVVVDRLLTDSGTDMRLALLWQGRAYRWFGPLDLARGC